MTSSVSSGGVAGYLRLLQRGRGQRLHLAVNSLGLIAGKVASMGLGFLFWLVAARVSSAHDVGLAAGSVSAMMLGTQLALLGLGAAFTLRLAEHERRPGGLLDTSITLVVVSAVVVSSGMLLVAILFLNQFARFAMSPAYALLFVAMTVFGTVGILLDQVSVALGRGPQVLSRNTISGLVSLVPLLVLPLVMAKVTAMELFALWVIGGVATCGYGARQLSSSMSGYRYRPTFVTGLAGGLVRLGLPNHLLTLSDRVPGLVLPVVVTEVLSPTANAHWYVVWMMAWIVYIAPNSFGLALFAEGARRPGSLDEVVGRSVRLAAAVGLGGALLVAVVAKPALDLLGSGYSAAGFVPLLILLLAVLPLTFVQAYYAACRARGRMREAVTAGVVTACLATAGTAIAGTLHGLVGMAAAWVVIQSLAGVWAGTRLRSMASRPQPTTLLTSPAAMVEAMATAVATAGAASPASVSGGAPGPGVTLAPPAPVAPAAVAPAAAAPAGTAHHQRGAHEPRREAPGRGGFGLRRRAFLTPADVAGVLGVLAGVLVWLLSIHTIDTTRIGDLGLVTLLPGPLLVAPAILTVSFVVQVSRTLRPGAWMMVLHVLVLIVMLYGVFAMVEVVPHNEVAYRHAGIIGTLLEGRHIDPTIDAYFDWPGFFALGALFTKAAGLGRPLDLAVWAAVWNNALYLAPLLLIARALTSDWRLRWVAIWIFYCANWVDQDYFSPQGFGYFLFLCILGLVLAYFRPAPTPRWISGRLVPHAVRRVLRWVTDAPGETPFTRRVLARRRPLVLVIVVVLIAGLVPSHQLTPYAVILALLALVVVNQCSSKRLPFVAILLSATWLVIATVPYLQGHLGALAGGVANVSQSTSANIKSRVAGSPGHLLVVNIRIALTAALLVFSAIGVVRRLRQGHRDIAAAALLVAPFLLFLLQPYGGEVLLRAYYFSLPFTAFLTAAAIVPLVTGHTLTRVLSALGTVLALFALLGAFGFARYGNERLLAFTPAEVAGVQHLYDIAPPGSLVIGGAANTPWQYTGYTTYHYATVTDLWKGNLTPVQVAGKVAARMRQVSGTPSYLLFTRSQGESVDLLGTLPRGSIEEVRKVVSSSPLFRQLWSNRDAQIYVLRTNASH